MRESENSELDVHEPAAFGQQLMLAREKAGMTLDEAARALNLKAVSYTHLTLPTRCHRGSARWGPER